MGTSSLINSPSQNSLKKSENRGAGLRPASLFSGNPCYMCVTSVIKFAEWAYGIVTPLARTIM